MAKKKTTKVDSKKKTVPVKAKTSGAKSITKSIDKSITKLASKALSVVGKVAKKVSKIEKPKKAEKPLKPVKVAPPVKVKEATVKADSVKADSVKVDSVKAAPVRAVIKTVIKPPTKPAPVKMEQDTGDTLIEMARNEMAAVKIGQTAEKVEKASKFKAIKVERGNVADEKAKWIELNKRHGKDKAENYKMTDIFESAKPIQHKVLGWGFVLTNDNDRLEVLFENGIKMLISNYKPN